MGLFNEHPSEAIKLYYKEALEIDLLPFGDIENEVRETRLEKPRLFAMDVPGFKETFPHAVLLDVGPGLQLKVCTLEGIVLLKIIANDDRPERTKDINDIDHILDVYFELCMEDIF